jgi:serine phosphatase RsbU (regulator of sigma subunit)
MPPVRDPSAMRGASANPRVDSRERHRPDPSAEEIPVPTDPIGRLLEALDTCPPFAFLDVLREHLTATVGARDVHLWLADYAGQSLELLRVPGDRMPDPSLPVDDEGPGQTFRSQQTGVHLRSVSAVVSVPVTVRAERLGVLQVHLPHPPAADDVRLLRATCSALAYVLLASRRYTDVFERARRQRDLEVPAEMQWELLPVLAHDGPDFDIAGKLEPAYDIGGDNFDYAVEPGAVTLSISDAMGHGTRAAMLSSLVVAVQRNARRRGEGIRQQVRAVNATVYDQFGGTDFATAMFLRAERSTGEVAVVNAGHSLAYILRDGALVPLAVDADVPMGLFPDAEYTLHRVRFAVGDRLILISDGVLEAATEEGDPYGEDRLREHLQSTAGESPVEVVRLLTAAVMRHRAGHLVDDATAVCLDYHATRREGRDRP